MKRRSWLSTLIAAFALCLAMSASVARAGDCANKWNEPKEVTGTGAKKADACRACAVVAAGASEAT